MKKYVKFKGKFADLIPDGWKFCKLFARNYRQYSKTCDGEQYSQKCRIWQHLGGYLEIDDLFDFSALIVEQIASGKIEEWATEMRSFFAPHNLEKNYCLIVDHTDGKIISQYSEEGQAIKRKEYSYFEGKMTKEERQAAGKELNQHFQRYRSFTLRPEMIVMIQDLLNKGWIEVVEDNRKERYGY